MFNFSRGKITLLLLASVATDCFGLTNPGLAADLIINNDTHTVSGSESYDYLEVGSAPNSGSAILNVGAGTTLNSGTNSGPSAKETFIGTDTGATGTVNVTGTNAIWNDNSTALLIGYKGTGTLNISEGGTVSAGQVKTATDAGTGSIYISDTGSKLISQSHVSFKKGTFEVKDGAQFETVAGGVYLNSATFIASGAGTSIKVGTANPGTPANWESADGFFNVESGTATISDGATLESDAGYVNGDGTGSTASMTVTGENTTWNAHLSLYVGGSGNGPSNNTGSLTISDGAQGSASVVGIGNDLGSTGSVLLTGTNTKLSSIHDSFSGNGYIGVDGTGTLTLQQGAKFTMDNVLRIGYSATGNGTLIIGAAADGAAVAAGSFETANGIEFGEGTGTIVLNHTETDYVIDDNISGQAGKGTIRSIAGKTTLSGTSSNFSGNVSLEGGTLTLGTNSAIGTSKLSITGGTLGLADGVTISNDIELANAAITVEVLTGNATLSGAMTNSADPVDLEKTGSGTLTLNQDQTYKYIRVGAGGLTLDNNTTSATGLFIGGDAQDGPIVTIQNASTLTLDSLVVGTFNPMLATQASHHGTLTLTGQGTTMTTTNSSRVDSGALNVLDGAHYNSNQMLTVGFPGKTDKGVVTVSGTGSQIKADNGMVIGAQGDGEFIVKDGATTVTDKGITIGQDANISGKLSVSGSGSLVDLIDAALVVGSSGNGTLDISEGAVVEAGQRVEVGSRAGSTGRLNVTGTGSTLKLTADGTNYDQNYYLSIGTSGTDAVATVSQGGLITGAQQIIAGFSTGSIGSLVVDGTGSKVVSDVYTMIGYQGSGTATLSNGGTVDVTDRTRGIYIAYSAGSQGVLNIGAAEGNDPATEAGIVAANSVSFGSGTGSIIFKHTTQDYSFGANISGSGALKILAGTTSLTGDNSNFTGLTTLSGGTLSVGAQSALGAGSLVFDGGTLATTGSFTASQNITLNTAKTGKISTAADTALTLSGVISGTGALAKTGSGEMFLTGTNTYSGNTSVNQGSLWINGSNAASSVTVSSAATFGGTGSIGALSILTGGTHAPGNKGIGTQTVNGNYSLANGSTLQIEVDDTGSMDKIAVLNNGTVSLDNASLSIIGLQGNFAKSEFSQIIIDNQGASAITGTFASITDDLAFYDASVDYTSGTGNDVMLTLKRNSTGYVDVAKTPNQKSVAIVLNTLKNADELLNNLLSLSETAVQEAYTQLTGNIYPITRQASVNLNQQVSQQVGTRLTALRTSTGAGGQAGLSFSAAEMAGFAQPQGMIDITRPIGESLGLSNSRINTSPDKSPNGLWSQTVGGKGIIDADGESVKTGYDWLGVIGGYDRALTPEFTLGAFFGYINGNSEQTAIRSRIDTDTFTAGLYGEYRLDDWRASGQVAWSRISSKSRRDLKIGGFDQSARADYTDQSLALDAELARTFEIDKNMWFEPYVSASVLQQYLGEFTETGAPGANLGRDDDTDLVGTSTFGVRFSSEYDLANNKKLLPQLGLALKHHIGATDNSSTLHFTSGGSDFIVNGTPKDRNMLAAKIGTALKFGDSFQAFASYNPSFGSKQTEHSFILGGRYEW
ncbi:autotransporter domain-containing protein [Thalassospira marina]|uniref:Autotransporter domain-containing protein n=1 Tax=Thalassospira marina TaxID=2048283 RepID=A0ABM6Q792_9PROT|nr:autotransporter domain-containing protein [Thalassospira marina]AUG52392.1 hypothetical protein CSC3H3_06440 [Thalassospira marina]